MSLLGREEDNERDDDDKGGNRGLNQTKERQTEMRESVHVKATFILFRSLDVKYILFS